MPYPVCFKRDNVFYRVKEVNLWHNVRAMFLLDSVPSSLPTTPISPSSLPLVVKVAGFVVSWATSIYFLWVRKQPPALADLPFFVQTQRISVVVTSIFLMLTWGAFGNSNSTYVLVDLAITCATVGVLVYFLTVHLTLQTQTAKHRSPVPLLACFLIYTSLISCGLTSAAVFITVLLSPNNAKAGTALVKPDDFVVTLKVVGTTIVSENKDIPFSVSSGQANFGCEEVHPYSVSVPLPQGATIAGHSSASFLNFANARIIGPPVVSADGVSATGALRGLDYQTFPFGVRNCPGGGHGELVLTGTYSTKTSHEEEATKTISNDVSTLASAPVLVTLPDLKITAIEVICQSKTHPDREWKTTVSPQETSSAAGPIAVVYIPERKQLSLSVKA